MTRVYRSILCIFLVIFCISIHCGAVIPPLSPVETGNLNILSSETSLPVIAPVVSIHPSSTISSDYNYASVGGETGNDPSDNITTDQILVRYDTSKISTLSISEVQGADIIRKYSEIGFDGLVLISVPADMMQEALLVYSQMPGVLYAEPDYIWEINRLPNDPEFWRQWGFSNTGQVYWEGKPAGVSGADGKVASAWDITTGLKDTIVAVLDTGIDYTHPDLSGNMWKGTSGEYGYDFFNRDSDPMDDNGHGTHCSGIIGAVGNNGIGVAGVSWQTRLIAVKVLGSDGKGRVSDVIEGIEYATRMGADVISCSFGGTEYSQAAYDVIAASPALMVCAAGNTGNNNDVKPVYPASYQLSTIIGVAATTAQDQMAGYSNYGTSVHVAAPGDQIMSTYLTYGTDCEGFSGIDRSETGVINATQSGKYAYISGSSQSTALVAGMGALLKGLDTALTPSEIRTLLISYSDPIPSLAGKVAANGRVNLYAAAQSLSAKDNVSLRSGWNFVSIPRPLAAGSDTASIFAKVSSGGHSLLTYESGQWRAMKASDPISLMVGYWVYSTKEDSVPITYYVNPGVVNRGVSAGWNTYGLPSNNSKSAKDALSDIAGIWKYLVGYDADIQKYEEPIINGGSGGQSDERMVRPFWGYWLYSSGGGTLQG